MHMRAVAPLLLVSLFLPFGSRPKPTSAADAEKAALANGSTSEGKAYASEVQKHISEQHEISLQECRHLAPEEPRGKFQLFLRVGKKGVVEEVRVAPEGRVSSCFSATVVKDHLKKPPKPSYWIRVEIAPPAP
jgi:hypothetical protein